MQNPPVDSITEVIERPLDEYRNPRTLGLRSGQILAQMQNSPVMRAISLFGVLITEVIERSLDADYYAIDGDYPPQAWHTRTWNRVGFAESCKQNRTEQNRTEQNRTE